MAHTRDQFPVIGRENIICLRDLRAVTSSVVQISDIGA